MPYALLAIGIVFLWSGIRNTYGELFTLIKGDFSSSNGFQNWIAVIVIVGALGYIPKFRALSVAFMSLLLLVLLVSNNGVFTKLQNALQGATGQAITPKMAPIVTSPTAGVAPLSPLDQINQNLSGGLPNG